MAKGIDVKKLCELTKLEIPEQNIPDISRKVEEVLFMFDKLDEFNTGDSNIPSIEDLKFEITFEDLRADEPRQNLELSGEPQFEFKLKNLKDGYILGPRI